MGKYKRYLSPADAIARGANAGHALATEHLLQVSRSLAPTDKNTLEDSGEAAVDEGSLTATVTYSTFYAQLMHEGLRYRHDDGQAKFLEAPSVGEMPVFAQLMARGAKKAMR